MARKKAEPTTPAPQAAAEKKKLAARKPAEATKPQKKSETKVEARKVEARKPETKKTETKKPETKKTAEARKPGRKAGAATAKKPTRTRKEKPEVADAEPVAQVEPRKKAARKQSAKKVPAAKGSPRQPADALTSRLEQQTRDFEASLNDHLESVRQRSAEVQRELKATLQELETSRRQHQTFADDAERTRETLDELQQQFRTVGTEMAGIAQQVEALRAQMADAVDAEPRYRTESEPEVLQASRTTLG